MFIYKNQKFKNSPITVLKNNKKIFSHLKKVRDYSSQQVSRTIRTALHVLSPKPFKKSDSTILTIKRDLKPNILTILCYIHTRPPATTTHFSESRCNKQLTKAYQILLHYNVHCKSTIIPPPHPFPAPLLPSPAPLHIFTSHNITKGGRAEINRRRTTGKIKKNDRENRPK